VLIHGKWYALQVRPRREVFVQDSLKDKGYEVFFPSAVRRRESAQRVTRAVAPIFPGYLFCQYREEIKCRILETAYVVRLVGLQGMPTPVDDCEMSHLVRVYNQGLPMEPAQYLNEGARVRIRAGPLKDVEGIFVQRRGACRLLLAVTLLCRALSVEVDGVDVEVVGKA
jgi:transcriptional antiterminator RfaH